MTEISETIKNKQSIDRALFVPDNEESDNLDNLGQDGGADDRFDSNVIQVKKLLQEPSKLTEVISLEEASIIFVSMYEIWIESDLPKEDQLRRNFREFLPEDYKIKDGDSCFEENALNTAYDNIKYQFGALDMLIRRYSDIFSESIQRLKPDGMYFSDPMQCLVLISEEIFYGYKIIFSLRRIHLIQSGTYVDILPDDIGYGKFSHFDTKDNNPHQNFLLYFYKYVNEQNLRKKGTDAYQQIQTELVPMEIELDNGETVVKDFGGYNTRAWSRIKEIKELVFSSVSKEENYEQWKNLTSGNSMNPIVDKIIQLKDKDFPCLVKDRHYISFLDGVYHAKYDEFYEYEYKTPNDVKEKMSYLKTLRLEREKHLSRNRDEIDKEYLERIDTTIANFVRMTRRRGTDVLDYNIATANYIPRKFIPNGCDNFQEYDDRCKNWRDIPTPNFDRVLDHQEFDQHQQLKCVNVNCRKRAMFSIKNDNRGRYCSDHKTGDMVDLVTPKCCNIQCKNFASYKDTVEVAKNNGREIAYYCEEHKSQNEEEIEPYEIDVEIGEYDNDVASAYTEKNLFYAIMGRLLYNIAELDNWQVIGFLKGLASTGKSTIIKTAQKFYSAEDCHILSNNIERKFGLEPLMEKFLFLAPEIKENLGLDQAEFQSMVSGDPMSIARKFKSAISINWQVPGLLAGNVPPKWSDKAGSIARRVLVFPFDKPVTTIDTTLEDEIFKEVPQILRKANLCYLALVNDLNKSNQDLWSIVPNRLLTARKELQQRISELGEFFQLNRVIKIVEGPDAQDHFVPWEVFLQNYTEWAKDNRRHHTGSLDLKEFSSFFDSVGIKIDYYEDNNRVPQSKIWPVDNLAYKGPFLIGLKYNMNE